AHAAEENYLFNATRSLRGDCATDASDLVPDPPIADCASGNHPSSPFVAPHAVAVDLHGDAYVSSTNPVTRESRVMVFGPSGLYLSELDVPAIVNAAAVDSEGQLYLRENASDLTKARVSRYAPEAPYEPL